MKTFTNEEARAMRGTEFTYIFCNGDTVPAFIAEVDLTIGFTAKALNQFTDQGWQIWEDADVSKDPKNYDNVSCVPLRSSSDTKRIKKIQKRLNSIASIGTYRDDETYNTSAIMATCNF